MASKQWIGLLLILAFGHPALGVVTKKYKLSELSADAYFAGVVRIRSRSPVHFEGESGASVCGYKYEATVEWASRAHPDEVGFFAAESVPPVEPGSTNLVLLFSSDPQEVERLMSSALATKSTVEREKLRCQIQASASYVRPLPPTMFRMDKPDSTLDSARVLVEPESVLLSEGLSLDDDASGKKWVSWPLIRDVLDDGSEKGPPGSSE